MNTRPDLSRLHPWSFACVLVFLLTAIGLPVARAYVLSGDRWPDGQPIVMDLGLGTPDRTLTDGSTSWDQVAEAALTIWNYYLKRDASFEWQETAVGIGANDDGKNEVFFSDSAYGEGFGDDTLAITISTEAPGTDIKTEADVIVNTAFSFDSYRGNLHVDGSGNGTYDLRRVLLHEFGHVLGLDHVPQNTASIMTPYVSNIDTIELDDINGVVAIYGGPDKPPTIYSDLAEDINAGGAFEYKILAYSLPKSFQASGLPSGLSIDRSNGFITGAATVGGTFPVTITATNAYGSDVETLVLTVYATPVITSPNIVTAAVGQFFVYRITADNGPRSYAIGSESTLPNGLSLDPTTGLITGVPTQSGILPMTLLAINRAGGGAINASIDVHEDAGVVTVHAFAANEGFDSEAPLVQTSDGTICGTTLSGGTDPYDPNTNPFSGGSIFELAPDLSVKAFFPFNTSIGSAPRAGLLTAADGNLYGTASAEGASDGGTVFKLAPDGTVTTVHAFEPGTGCYPYTELIQASDGNIYGTTTQTGSANGAGGTIFKIDAHGAVTTMHTFKGTEGGNPSKLIQAGDGNLYGTTKNGYSTVFRLGLNGTFATIYTFDPSVGASPASLTQGNDGFLYGALQTTNGTFTSRIFKVDPKTAAFTSLHLFIPREGFRASALCLGRDGNFYGTTTYGTGVDGNTLFRCTPEGVMTVVHTFAAFEGTPRSALIQAADGEFYGTTDDDGIDSVGPGRIFRTTLNGPANLLPTVSLTATTPRVTAGGGGTGAFTVSLSAAQAMPVIIYYTVKGSAANGTDYVYLKGKKKIKPGELRKTIRVVPEGDLGGEAKKVVKLVLQPDPNYNLGAPMAAKVKIIGQ